MPGLQGDQPVFSAEGTICFKAFFRPSYIMKCLLNVMKHIKNIKNGIF